MIVITFQLNMCNLYCLSIIPRQSFIDIQSAAMSVAALCTLGLESLGSLTAVKLTSIISLGAKRQIIQLAIRPDFTIEVAISK